MNTPNGYLCGIILLCFTTNALTYSGVSDGTHESAVIANSPLPFDRYLGPAMHGDAESQNKLGLIYYEGTAIKRDVHEAIKWLMKAAQQGHEEAQYNLAQLYYLQAEMAGNQDQQALLWFRRAAEQGHIGAQLAVGMMYFECSGTSVDFNESLVWLTKSANQGNAMAQNQLGIAYETGKGVIQDEDKAILWYKISAENGLQNAHMNLVRIVNRESTPIHHSHPQLTLDTPSKKGDKYETTDKNKTRDSYRDIDDCTHTRAQCQAWCTAGEMVAFVARLAGAKVPGNFNCNACQTISSQCRQ